MKMASARLAFYSTVLFFAVGAMEMVLFSLVLVENPKSYETVVELTMLHIIIIYCFVLASFLRKKSIKHKICWITKQGERKQFSGSILVGIIFGVLWRSILTIFSIKTFIRLITGTYDTLLASSNMQWQISLWDFIFFILKS